MPFSSAAEAFDELLRRIELNQTRVALASQRYSAVKAVIEAALPGKSVRQIGSFQRKTKIRPADLSDQLDIDVVVSFGPFYQYAAPQAVGTTPSTALDIVRRALGTHQVYRVMPQRLDHPVVRLEYADQMSIELVPAYEDHTGQHPRLPEQPACYIIGSSGGFWRAADYDYDAQTITSLNTLSRNKLVPTIKLVKAYFRNAGVPLKSFHVEVLVANTVPATIKAWEEKNYSYGYQFLLANFLTQVSKTIIVPASLWGSYSPPLNSDLGQSTLASLGTFLAARAEVAWKLCNEKVVGSALSGWRDFFGDGFPS